MEMTVLTEENFDEHLAAMTAKYLSPKLKLISFGIVGLNDPRNWNTKKESSKSINKLLKEIPRVFQKHSPLGKKYWNTSSSYGCKHQLADEIEKTEANGYSTNGEFIFAMMLLGYEMKPINLGIHPISPNVTFNCSKRDLSKVICECGLQYSKVSKSQHYNSKNHQFIMGNKHLNDTDSQFGDYLDQAIERLKKN
jgi:hypothetical protein